MITTARTALSAERPFPGLRPYDIEDSEFYFGREDQIYALYRLLGRSHFIAVVGSSGSGKSSLVRAGLVPLLNAETTDAGGRSWRCLEMRPGDAPLSRLADALATLLPEAEDDVGRGVNAARRERIAFALRQSSFGLGEALDSLEGLGGSSLVLVVDQFEELFRYTASTTSQNRDIAAEAQAREDAAHFVQLLLEVSRTRKRAVHVIITMRSDFIGDCARFHQLPEAVSATQFLVPSLSRDQREEIIRKPIEKAGATIEASLVERLLNDSGDELDQLPVVQHCLMRLWDRAAAHAATSPASGQPGTNAAQPARVRHLTLAHYTVIGGIAGALAQHAEEVLASLPGLESAVEQTFRALAEIDREGRAIRRAIPFVQLLAETGIPENQLRKVIDRLRESDCSFLVPPPSAVPVLAPHTRIDVGHEALLRRWKRLSGDPATPGHGWLRTEDEDGRLYRGLLALIDSESIGRTTLPPDQVETRWKWWTSRPRTEAWADRYGGGLDRVERLFKNSFAARKQRRQKIATLCAAVAGGIILFVYLQWDSARTANLLAAAAKRGENNAQIYLNEALIAESRTLANEAEKAEKTNKRTLAVLLALEALPDTKETSHPEKTNRPIYYLPLRILSRNIAKLPEFALIPESTGVISSVVVTSAGSRIVTGSFDKTARVWDARTGKVLLRLTGHAGPIRSVAVTPDGTRIVTGSVDSTARVWDARTGAELLQLKGHTGPIYSVAVTPDGRIVTGSFDKTARVWDVRTGAELRRLRGHRAPVSSVAVTRDGARIVTGSYDKTARVWNAHDGYELQAARKQLDDPVYGVAVTPDSTRIVTASSNEAWVWDARSKEELFRFMGHRRGSIYTVVLTPDGRIVTGSSDRTARMWDGRTGSELLQLKGHTGPILGVAVTADGTRIVTGSYDKTARVWDVRTGAELLQLKGHTGRIYSVAVTPDGRIVTGSQDTTARVWDARTGAELLQLKGHTGPIYSVAVTPDGRIVTGSFDRTARMWDGRTGSELLQLKGHTGSVRSVAVTPDGTRIVTGSSDRTARMWDGRTGSELLQLKGHIGPILSVAVTADGTRIVTGSYDKTARVWLSSATFRTTTADHRLTSENGDGAV